jgi:RimJ/RimL family protein N-acetyltransferase
MQSRLDDVTWPFLTERLALRRATESDIDTTWRFRRSEEVNRWITVAPGSREEYAERFVEPERLAKTLVFERDGEVIGDLMFALEDAWAQAEVAEQARGVQAELGWCLDPEHGGHGYATEAVGALVRIAFEELGLHRVTASCFADNEPSWRLMERLGMRRELYAVRESLHRSGRWLDAMGYALLADEWHAWAAGRPPLLS